MVRHALECIDNRLGWRSTELEGFIGELSEQRLPLVHFFEKFARVTRTSKVRCVPWLSARPGETLVGVRIGERDVTVRSAAGPLFLEDDFPFAKATIRDGAYMLFKKTGTVLTRVPISLISAH